MSRLCKPVPLRHGEEAGCCIVTHEEVQHVIEIDDAIVQVGLVRPTAAVRVR